MLARTWNADLPPGIARDADGALRIGSVAANELVRTFGTPLLVIDTDVLDANVERVGAAAREAGADVAYAGKALLFVALARRLAATSLLLDVCSLGELLVAERAGFPAHRLVLHGCGKTEAELRAAADGRVGRIVVDGFDELARLSHLAGERPIDVVLRINPGVRADTHSHLQTAGRESKFGFSVAESHAAVRDVVAHPMLRMTGIHMHLGSQLFSSEPLLASMETALDVVADARAAGAPAQTLIAGGGFGVAGSPNELDLDLPATLRALAEAVARSSAVRGIATPRLGIEPGRALIANAGTSLYRVVAVKRHGLRPTVIVDGSVADNPRPSLYGAYHHPLLASRSSDAAAEITAVCGRSCESDELVVAPLPADIQPGDVLALCISGGYTFSMASNYNRFPRPAVVFAGGGRSRIVVNREREEDLLASDVDDDA